MQSDLGDGVSLRAWRRGDEPALVRYANNRRVAAHLRDRFPHPYTPADARAWIAHVEAEQPRLSFAVATATEAIGGIGLVVGSDIYRRSAEIGYWLGEPFWGRGIATRAVRQLTETAFAEHDLVRIWAGVFAGNPASARVLEKAGYELEGRLRQAVTKWEVNHDMLLYARLRP